MKFYQGDNVMKVPLEEQTNEKLAEWWNSLNNWEWPVDMPGKPKNFDGLKEHDMNSTVKTKFSTINKIMMAILKIAGLKEIMHWHHVNKLNETEEEFQKWWVDNVKRGNIPELM
jgi:hypothetical protein